MENKIKSIRLQMGFTLADMAKQLNISPSYYFHLERGTRKLSLEMALKIVLVLKQNPNDLYDLFFNDFAKRQTEQLPEGSGIGK